MPGRRGRTGGSRYPEALPALPPQRRWKAITLATLLVVPAFWMMMAGVVAAEVDERGRAPDPVASLALGLAVIPFVFMVLAFVSEHPRAPSAVLKAMGLSLLVGTPVFAVAADAVTGIVAGLGSGGIVALRKDDDHNSRARAMAVATTSIFIFVLVRIAGPAALLPAPILPFTSIGVADHLSERARDDERLRRR